MSSLPKIVKPSIDDFLATGGQVVRDRKKVGNPCSSAKFNKLWSKPYVYKNKAKTICKCANMGPSMGVHKVPCKLESRIRNKYFWKTWCQQRDTITTTMLRRAEPPKARVKRMTLSLI